jgi:hypothetical protein
MAILSDNDIDNMLTIIGDGRTVTIDPDGDVLQIPNLPVKFDDASQREDLATGQVIATRPQILVRRSAVEGHVAGGHKTGTDILDDQSGILYRVVDVLFDAIYAKILLTKA